MMDTPARLRVAWIDLKRQPTAKPNPRFPNGVDVDLSNGAPINCTAQLPYPARGCGYWVVKCSVCGIQALATAAGRPDDPRSVMIACKPLVGIPTAPAHREF